MANPSNVEKVTDTTALVSPKRLMTMMPLVPDSPTKKLAVANVNCTSLSMIVRVAVACPRAAAPIPFTGFDSVRFSTSSPSTSESSLITTLKVLVTSPAANVSTPLVGV